MASLGSRCIVERYILFIKHELSHSPYEFSRTSLLARAWLYQLRLSLRFGHYMHPHTREPLLKSGRYSPKNEVGHIAGKQQYSSTRTTLKKGS